jgi:hypothetical protein
LLRRSLGALGEIDAAADKVRKVIPLAGAQEELPNGSKRPWRGVELAAKREVRAQHELISALEAFTICSETLETGAAQNRLAVDVGPLTELRIVTTPTHALVERALLAAEQIRMEAGGWLVADREAEPRDELKGDKKSPRKATVNIRMLEVIQDNPESLGWNSPQWARHLKCGKSTVVETKTWKDLRTGRERERAERALDRRRKPRASDLHRD